MHVQPLSEALVADPQSDRSISSRERSNTIASLSKASAADWLRRCAWRVARIEASMDTITRRYSDYTLRSLSLREESIGAPIASRFRVELLRRRSSRFGEWASERERDRREASESPLVAKRGVNPGGGSGTSSSSESCVSHSWASAISSAAALLM